MFKTITIYRPATDWAPSLEDMESALDDARFIPCGPTQELSMGWIEPREAHGPLVESIAGQRIMRLRIETRGVPGSTVRAKAQEAADAVERDTGRKPGKKQMKELREEALRALLPQAFPRQTDVWVCFNFAHNTLIVDAGSQGKLDEVITALVRTFDGLSMRLLQTNMSPQTAMAEWLTTDSEDWPGQFSVERACELKSGDEQKSVVKFSRHNLATDEIRKHIAEGKLPVSLAMSYDGRVGFVLTTSMHLRKFTLLDAALESRNDKTADGFDTDVTLATGELNLLIPALIEALGGELVETVQIDGAPAAGVTIYSDGNPDPLLDDARALVVAEGRASISYVQRKLAIGYNRAAGLIEDLEKLGVVSPMNSSGLRDVLVSTL